MHQEAEEKTQGCNYIDCPMFIPGVVFTMLRAELSTQNVNTKNCAHPTLQKLNTGR